MSSCSPARAPVLMKLEKLVFIRRIQAPNTDTTLDVGHPPIKNCAAGGFTYRVAVWQCAFVGK